MQVRAGKIASCWYRLCLMFIADIFSLTKIPFKISYSSKSSIALSVQSLGLLKNHTGKHTITRIPPTEKRNRRHTSIVSISLLEIKEVKCEINEKDLDISFMGSNCKAGGQNSNSVNSACRIVHKPTGISVKCDQERDQIQNRKIALRILTAKLLQRAKEDHNNELYNSKSSQMKGMNRGDRSFTWNLYEGVITKHDTGKQSRKIKDIFKGYLELLE